MLSTKPVAVIGGTFIRPGISKNKRLYTSENIGRAVARMQEALKNTQGIPITMATSHGAAFADDPLDRVARVTSIEQVEDGSARWTAEIANTEKGRDIAVLGQGGFIRPVSIRGSWIGDVKTVEHEGDEVVTADDLAIIGIDFTNSPGVEGAEIDFVNLVESSDPNVFIESAEVQLLQVFNEEAEEEEDFHARVHEAVEAAVLDVLEADKSPYGDVSYADPGYQPDKKKRYPIDSEEHVRAAWSYINQGGNASKYSPAQVARIKSKIKRAAKKYDIDIASEYLAIVQDVRETFGAYMTDEAAIDAATTAALLALFPYNPDGESTEAAKVMGGIPNDGIHGYPKPQGGLDTGGGDRDEDDVASGCAVCGAEDLPTNAMYCPTCGHPVPTAESTDAALTQTTEEITVSDETNTTADTSADESGQAPATVTLTVEAVQEMIDKAVAEATAKTAPVVEAAPAEAETTEAETKETTVSEGTFTAEQVAEIATRAATEAVAAAKAQAIEDYRSSDSPTRKGLVGDNGAGGVEEDRVYEAEELAKMPLTEFRSVARNAWEHDPFMSNLFARADRGY